MRELEDDDPPSLLRHLFPAGGLPGFALAGEPLAAAVAPSVRCVDATLSAGRALLRQPSPAQAVALWELLERAGRPGGLVARVELALEDAADRALLELALSRREEGESHLEPVPLLAPEPAAVAALRGLHLAEVGLSWPASDHLLAEGGRVARASEARRLLALLDACAEAGLRPRLQLLDVTRADLDGCLLPLLEGAARHLARSGAPPLRLRLCDSYGLGLPFAQAAPPRSLPRLLGRLREVLGLGPDQLEVEAREDLGLALACSLAALAHGAGSVVGALGGAGERAGLAATELLLVHLAGYWSTEVDLAAIEPALSIVGELGLALGPRHPLWGQDALSSSSSRWPRDLEHRGPFHTERALGRSRRSRG